MSKIQIENPIVPLETSFINKYLPFANPTHVVVYIYALGLCYSNKPADNKSIAEALDILESDVIKAWKYWRKKGLISIGEDGSVTFLSSFSPSAPEKKAIADGESDADAAEAQPQRRDIPMNEITKKLENDAAFSETLKMAQMIWGAPFSPAELKTIYSLVEWYSFSNEVLLILIEYCSYDGKTKNAKYLESVAEGWHKDGIVTAKDAEKVLKRREKERTMVSKCAKIFGLSRAFSDRETEYIAAWTNDFQMSEAMIKEAYARTTLNIGKLSFQYMNKILSSWYSDGIKTLAALKEAEGARKKPREAAPKNTRYDFDEIERLEFERRMKKTQGE